MFDHIPHECLLSKLDYYSIHGQTRNWIASFLHNHTQNVSVNGVLSDEASVTSGVPQGSVFGPVLFLLYISDISDNITSNMHLFADDSIIYCEIVSEDDHCVLQTDLEELVSWTQTWQMDFNVTKYYLMFITTKINNSMLNQPLSCVHHSKYLGVTIDSNVSRNEHITLTVAKSYNTLALVKRTLSTCSHLESPHIKSVIRN